MMLAASTLSTAAAFSAAIFSPSRMTCKKRVSPSRFRYEPYGARVLSLGATDGSSAPKAAVYTAIASAAVAATPIPVEPILPIATPIQAPLTVTSVKASTVRFVIVQFKHDTATFVAPFKVSVGDLVVVEGDRGENIGVVSEITKETPEYAVPNKVVRRATDKDREALAAQREREVAAVVSTRALAESFGLHGRVEDAEYQFDLNKLTIFVRRPSKSTFVDFRKLQRSLFREFRCRIWCAYLDEVEAAEAAPRCK